MLGRGVSQAVDRRLVRPEELWGYATPLLDSADLRIINLECPLTDYEQRWTPTPKRPHSSALPSAIETLLAATSTPVAGQQPQRGLRGTGLALHMNTDVAGIRHAGAGRDREEPPTWSFRAGERRSGLGSWSSRTGCRLSRRETTGPDGNDPPVSSEPEVLRQVEGAVSSLRVMGSGHDHVLSSHGVRTGCCGQSGSSAGSPAPS